MRAKGIGIALRSAVIVSAVTVIGTAVVGATGLMPPAPSTAAPPLESVMTTIIGTGSAAGRLPSVQGTNMSSADPCQPGQVTTIKDITGNDTGIAGTDLWGITRIFMNTGSRCEVTVPRSIQVAGASGNWRSVPVRNAGQSKQYEVDPGQTFALTVAAWWTLPTSVRSADSCTIAEADVTSIAFSFGDGSVTFMISPAWARVCSSPVTVSFEVQLNPSFG